MGIYPLLDGNSLEHDSYNNPTSRTVPYYITNADNAKHALLIAKQHAPSMYDGLYFNGVSLNKENNDGTYEVSVKYIKKNINGNGQQLFRVNPKPQISWQANSITETRTHSLERVYTDPDAPNHIKKGTAINQSSDGEVQGVPIIIGKQSFSETHYFNENNLTSRFKNNLTDLVGTTNNASFRGYPAGSVKFDGANFSYTKDQDEKVPVNFQFTVSKQVDLSYLSSSALPGVKVKGWFYKWFYKKEVEDSENNEEVEIKSSLVIDRVYPKADFRKLKIGTK